MIRHIVMFKFKPEFSAEQRKDWIDRSLRLTEEIDVIRSITAGEDVLRLPRSFDAALVADFDDLEGLNTYQEHPAHQAVIAISRPNAEQIASVDFAF